MNIGNLPNNAFPNVYAISAAQGNRVSVPVSPSAYIYSHFEHISGVPAPDGVSGVNINKLKIIDTLIDQLSRIRKETETIAIQKEEDDENRINALIEKYQNEIRTFQAANTNNPYAPNSSLAGAIFSISV
jgi:hypothetical protein